jgi:hypothetical protein
MKILLACCVVVLLASFFLFHITTVQGIASDVMILSHHGFLDAAGYYHVFGEVKSNGLNPLQFVQVTASFYNISGTFITTSNGFTEVDVLFPGRKAGFHILLYDKNSSAQVDHYTLDQPTYLTYDKTKPPGLKILSHNKSLDTFGYIHVTGQLQNVGTNSTTYAEVIATFYDQTGTVLGCDYTFSNPSDLNPGQIAPFEVIFTYNEVTVNISTYDLTCQSWDYSDTDPQVQLNLSAGPGGTTNPTPGTYNVTLGQTTEATALPASGYGFLTWELNGYDTSSQTHILVVMATNATLRALFRDNTPPTIGTPSQMPGSLVDASTAVEVTVSVTDAESGVKSVKLNYRTNATQIWNDIPMTYNATSNLYECTIPPQPANTLTNYRITAEDNAGNQITLDNSGQYYTYTTLPEFSLGPILVLLAGISILATLAFRRRLKTQS